MKGGNRRSQRFQSGNLGLVLLGALLVPGAAFLNLMTAHPGNIDDAFIVLVYARHFLDSGKFYWNLADGFLDGFTSLLDVLVKALAIDFFPADPIFTISMLTCLLFAAIVATAIAITIHAHTRQPASRILAMALLAGLAVGSTPSLAESAAYLLEGPLFVLVTLWASWSCLQLNSRSWPILLAETSFLVATSLARPEGIPLALGLATVASWTRKNLSVTRRLMPPALLLGTIIGYVAWHWSLFGTVAPNTYFAKTSSSRWLEILDGLRYVGAYARMESGLGALKLLLIVGVPLLLFFPVWKDHHGRVQVGILAFIALGSLAMVVVSGGDCYRGSRLLVLPLLFLPTTLIVAAARMNRLRFLPIALLVILTIGQIAQSALVWENSSARNRIAWPHGLEKDFWCDQEISSKLARIVGEGPVAQSDYQRLKFFADSIQVIDLVGLNNREIAHQLWDSPVLYGKYKLRNGIETAAPIWIYGKILKITSVPMTQFPMDAVLRDAAVASIFIGYLANPQNAKQMSKIYTPASIQACGGYFNLLVQRDQARFYSEKGLLLPKEIPPPSK